MNGRCYFLQPVGNIWDNPSKIIFYDMLIVMFRIITYTKQTRHQYFRHQSRLILEQQQL